MGKELPLLPSVQRSTFEWRERSTTLFQLRHSRASWKFLYGKEKGICRGGIHKIFWILGKKKHPLKNCLPWFAMTIVIKDKWITNFVAFSAIWNSKFENFLQLWWNRTLNYSINHFKIFWTPYLSPIIRDHEFIQKNNLAQTMDPIVLYTHAKNLEDHWNRFGVKSKEIIFWTLNPLISRDWEFFQKNNLAQTMGPIVLYMHAINWKDP